MEQTWLPGKVRDRIRDLMKERGLTQAELALRIGTTESTLSRFLSGKTDKLGDESIIRLARTFNVSTDFLLGESDVPDRVNYDISELGLSVQAARNLYTKKVDARVVNRLLESPRFAETTYQISGFLSDELASGFAAQNQIYASAAALLKGSPEAAADAERLKTPIHQVELQTIEDSFMHAVREIKREVGLRRCRVEGADRAGGEAHLRRTDPRPEQAPAQDIARAALSGRGALGVAPARRGRGEREAAVPVDDRRRKEQ